MDCTMVLHRLDEIQYYAERAKEMVMGGNTGKEFSATLDILDQLTADIREECYGITVPKPYPYNP